MCPASHAPARLVWAANIPEPGAEGTRSNFCWNKQQKVERVFPLDSDGHASRPRRRPRHAAVVSREGAPGTVVEKLPTWLPRRELWEVVVAGEALPPGLRRGEFRW
jgi:hypothetical protein